MIHALLVASLVFSLSLPAHAEEEQKSAPPSQTAPESGSSPPVESSPPLQAVPNRRDLSPEDYQWLGQAIWENMQGKADPAKPEFRREDIARMVDDMQRSRGEVTLNLADLTRLLQSSEICRQNRESQRAHSWGADPEQTWESVKEIFR